MSTGHSAVADFYRNKNLFVTGGTGFLGLGLIEKALRSLNVCVVSLLFTHGNVYESYICITNSHRPATFTC